MTVDLDAACARLARQFPHVDRRWLRALFADCYRLVSRHTHERRIDKVEELCRLRLQGVTRPPVGSSTYDQR